MILSHPRHRAGLEHMSKGLKCRSGYRHSRLLETDIDNVLEDSRMESTGFLQHRNVVERFVDEIAVLVLGGKKVDGMKSTSLGGYGSLWIVAPSSK